MFAEIPRMRRLHNLSLSLTLAGVVAVVLGLLLDLSPAITLVGLLLVVAGVVKVATVHLWRTMFEADQRPPTSP